MDEKYFVVGGILTNSNQDLLLAYKQFKKSVDSIPMTRKQKEKITYEFKAILLDRSYPQIKRKMLYKLNTFDCKVIYSTSKIIGNINQQEKEKTYIFLLKNIVKSIKDDVIIVTFDAFGNVRFEKNIISEIGKIENVKFIRNEPSFNSKGLQFADNVCGVIRKHLTNNDTEKFYQIIQKKVIEIE